MNQNLADELIKSTATIGMVTSRISQDADRDPLASPSKPGPSSPTSRTSFRPSFSSVHSSGGSTYTTRPLQPTPSFSAPTALISLMSLGTQHSIEQTAARQSAQTDFLLTSPLSLPPPNASRVAHLRPARKEDIDAITNIAQRIAATSEADRFLQPGMEQYPADFRRTLHSDYSSCLHHPRTVMLVAEVANQAGFGAEKTRREVVGVLVMQYRGKKQQIDDGDGERAFAGTSRVQLRSTLQRHFHYLRSTLHHHLDRSRSRAAGKLVSNATPTYLPPSTTGFDRSAFFSHISSPDDTTTDSGDPSGDFWLLQDLSVDPAHAGTGVGGRLARLVVAAARERGEMVVLCANPGVDGFFARCGFDRYGSTVVEGREWVEMFLRIEDGAVLEEEEEEEGDR